MTRTAPNLDEEAGRSEILRFYNHHLQTIGLPFNEHSVETSYGLTNVVSVGNKAKPAVIALHGINVAAPLIIDELKRLSLSFCLYAPDIPGHCGKSSGARLNSFNGDHGKWLLETIHGLKLNGPVPVIGVSYGGFIALQAALEGSDVISKLVLLSPSGLVSWFSVKLMRDLLVPRFLFRRNIGIPGHNKEARLRAIYDTMYSAHDENWLRWVEIGLNRIGPHPFPPPILARRELGRLKQPVQVIAAESDIFFPWSKLSRAAAGKLAPLADVHMVPNSKHVFSETQWSEVCDRIVAFLTGDLRTK